MRRREGARRTRSLGVVALAAVAAAAVWPHPAAAQVPLPGGSSEHHQRSSSSGHGGAVLDGQGGIHPFGGFTLDTRNAPSWPGRDIARSLVVRSDGSGGWVLDGWGGIHAFGTAPPVASPVHWAGWDIARAMAIVPGDDGDLDGREGYVLDGYGGLHPWGGAPALDSGVSWPGQDIARGLALHERDGVADGGWILDGYGGVHAFGAADQLTGPAYYPGRDLYQQLHIAGDTAYTVTRWGRVDGLGTTLTADWSGYADWGAWDILRDVVLLDASDSDGDGTQPVSAAAAQALRMHVDRYTLGVPTYRQIRSLDCEAAALQVALAAVGTNESQDWIITTVGTDTKPPQMGPGGAVARWGDPYTTFVGRIDGSEPGHTGYGVYYPPIAAAAQAAGRTADGRQGWDPWALYDQVAQGHPAVVWLDATFTPVAMRHWTAWDGRDVPYAIGEHAVALVGVDAVAGTVTLADVMVGARRTFTMSRFQAMFASFGNMAVVVS